MIVMMCVVVHSQNEKNDFKITLHQYDSIVSTRLHDHLCDSSLHWSFLCDAPPLSIGGMDKIPYLINQVIELDPKCKGQVIVRMIVNCKGESDFIYTMYEKSRRNLIKYADTSNLKQVLQEQLKWKPATIDGEAVNAEHWIRLIIKKGKVIKASDPFFWR